MIKLAKASWVECGINTGLEGLHVRHNLEASHTRTQDIDGITAVWQPPAVALLASAGERDGGPDPARGRPALRRGRTPRQGSHQVTQPGHRNGSISVFILLARWGYLAKSQK